MRLGRVVAAMFGMGAMFADPVRSGGGDWESVLWSKPRKPKSKPNRISQAKRRKYKRQGRG